jgi:DNA-binding NarL/FixJ family response regulator
MNSNSNRFAILEHDALLASLPPAANAPTGLDPARVRPPSKTADALWVVPDPRAGECGAPASLADALRARYPSSPVVVFLLGEHSDETLRAIGLREMERFPGSWSRQVTGSAARPISPATSAEGAPIMRESARPAAEPPVGSRPPTARSLGLTQRQMDVLALMVQGKPNKLICRELDLAEGTVKCHVSAILRALEVGSRTQAALKAARLGLGADPVGVG